MYSYTVMLTDAQYVALLYETERRSRLAPPVAPGATPPPPLTPQEVLQQRVAQDLDSLGLPLADIVDPLRAILARIEPGARPGLLAALERPSLEISLRSMA